MPRSVSGLGMSLRLLGAEVLRQPAKVVPVAEITETHYRQFFHNLKHAMFQLDGTGLAAPQVGHSVRALVATVEEPNSQPMSPTIFVNPELHFPDEKDTFTIGRVQRKRVVEMKYYDEEAQPRTIRATGFVAGLLQHEADHLDGTLFIDRVDTRKDLFFLEEFDATELEFEPGAYTIL